MPPCIVKFFYVVLVVVQLDLRTREPCSLSILLEFISAHIQNKVVTQSPPFVLSSTKIIHASERGTLFPPFRLKKTISPLSPMRVKFRLLIWTIGVGVATLTGLIRPFRQFLFLRSLPFRI